MATFEALIRTSTGKVSEMRSLGSYWSELELCAGGSGFAVVDRRWSAGFDGRSW